MNNGICRNCGSENIEVTGDLFWCHDCGNLLADTQGRTRIDLVVGKMWAPSPRSGRRCGVEGCNQSHYASGYCQSHYYEYVQKARRV